MVEISKELQMLDDALMEIHDRIKSGRCLTNKLQIMQMNSFLRMLCNKDEGMSFAEACSYTQIRPSTFRKYVKDGKLMLETGKHPGQLKDEVCSPGGATIQGIRALEEAGFRGAVMDAVIAAWEKSAEMK